MTPRRFKCSQFRESILDFNFECTKLLQNDFRKQRYITLNATIPGQDRIYPKTHLCSTFFAEYIYKHTSSTNPMLENRHSSESARCFDVIYYCKVSKSDVSNGVIWCEVLLTLERRYAYI